MSQSISQWETWYHSSLPFTPAFVADLTVCGNQHGRCSVTVTYNQLVLWLRLIMTVGNISNIIRRET